MDLTALLIALLTLFCGLGVGWLAGRSRSSAEVTDARSQAAASHAALEAERLRSGERVAAMRAEQERLQQEFGRLAHEALAQNNERFLALAEDKLKAGREQAGADLQARQQAVEQMVRPISEELERLRTQVSELERIREGAYRELRQQVTTMNETSEKLRVETSQLVTALRAPQVRGRWGEMQLRRVIESAGMVEHCDFTEQQTVTTSDGDLLRPDLVIHLAGGKQVVVDSKVPFAGYLEAMEARDDSTRAERLKAHARHMRKHIDDLAAKAYWEHLDPTPEFVVMFVPAEVFLNAALDEDPSLLDHAFDRNVVIATPQTLIALLRTVAYTWRQEALADSTRRVLELGRELHGRLAVMGGHVSTLGKELTSAVKAYNATVGALESRVLVTARKLTEMQVVDATLETPGPIDLATREVAAPELVAHVTGTILELPDSEEIADPRYGVDPGTARRESATG